MLAAPKLFRVLLEVANLDQASAFYSKLLGIEGRRVGGGRCYYDCGPVLLGLVDVAIGKKEPRPNPQDLYFSVSDLEATHSRAKTLGCLSKEQVHGERAGDIVTRPW